MTKVIKVGVTGGIGELHSFPTYICKELDYQEKIINQKKSFDYVIEYYEKCSGKSFTYDIIDYDTITFFNDKYLDNNFNYDECENAYFEKYKEELSYENLYLDRDKTKWDDIDYTGEDLKPFEEYVIEAISDIVADFEIKYNEKEGLYFDIIVNDDSKENIEKIKEIINNSNIDYGVYNFFLEVIDEGDVIK